MIHRLPVAFVAGLLAATLALAARAAPLDFHSFSDDADRATADVLQIANPLAALGISYYRDDKAGMRQLAYTVGTTLVATEALKIGFDHTSWGERPDGGRKSFPSGHTAGACSGAAYMSDRYGWQWGLPFYLTSAFVGYNRVDEHRHWTRDVIGGCVVAIGASRLFTTRYPDTHLRIAPMLWSGDGLGLSARLDF